MSELNTHGFAEDAPSAVSRCRVCGQRAQAPVHDPGTARALPDAVGALTGAAAAGRESLITFVDAVKEKF